MTRWRWIWKLLRTPLFIPGLLFFMAIFYFFVINRPVDLTNLEIHAIKLSLREGGDSICPGRSTPLQVSATVKRWGFRQTLQTWESSLAVAGRLDFEDFEFNSNHGTVDRRGRFQPSGDPLEMAARPFIITAAPRSSPERLSTLSLPPSYDCVTRVGTSGRRGGTGQPGGPGPHLVAYVTVVETPFHPRLLAVRLTGDTDTIALAPADRELTLFATGGAGGAGRAGTDGRDGSCGVIASNGSDGGDGGNGGSGGPGGFLNVVVDPRFPELMELLAIDVRGGAAGAAGRAGRGGSGGRKSFDDDKCGRPGRSGEPGRPGLTRGTDGVSVMGAGDVSDAFEVLDGTHGVLRLAGDQEVVP